MNKVLKSSWALFTGIAIILIANGLQGTLLGVRSVIENFNYLSTGIMMSGYWVGYFLGSNSTPKLVQRVGHIRVFAAFASAASLSILIIATYVNPIIWTLGRFITGFSLVSCYIVCESWLNDRANNRTRGKILSVYMFISYFALALGALLLNFNSPKNFEPFILVSVLLSLALIPILLTKRKAPKFKKIGTLNLKELYKISPLGVFSSFCTGTIYSALFTMTAVYAAQINFTYFEISLLLFLITIAGAIVQGPVGYLSDKFDRRLIIILCTLFSAAFCILSIIFSDSSLQNMYLATNWGLNKTLFFVTITLYSGVALCLFSLNLAHTNDYVSQEKFVAAGGGLQFVFGFGAMGGPILCSLFMNFFGPNGFFVFLFIFHVIIGLFGIYRMTRRATEENPDNTFTPLPRNITPAGIELDPDTGVDLSKAENK